jgi:hypothetical protein
LAIALSAPRQNSEIPRMKIAFASAALPESGTVVVLAAGATLGPAAAELDQRTGGAIGRAI